MSKTLTTKASKTETKTQNGSKFVYVTYIRTTAKKLWDALTKPEFTKQYWCGCEQQSDWELGSSWKLVSPDGRAFDIGEVLEIEPPCKLIVSWHHQINPELKADGVSQLTFELESMDELVKLTITHEIEKENSKLIQVVSTGWPAILSSLKSLLETGESHKQTRKMPAGI